MSLLSPSLPRISSLEKEGPLHISKSIKHRMLLDEKEMEELLLQLGSFYLCPASGPVTKEQVFISKEKFLMKYKEYVSCLKEGEAVDEQEMRRFFCCFLSSSLDPLYLVPIGKDRFIVKAARPVIQVQFHHFYASSLDGKLHSMVLSKDSISWGVQFSYPQIFEDPATHTFSKVTISDNFPNTALFKNMVSFLRYNAVPTPFIFKGNAIRATFRLGKDCFSWISKHPGLQSNEIFVKGDS